METVVVPVKASRISHIGSEMDYAGLRASAPDLR